MRRALFSLLLVATVCACTPKPPAVSFGAPARGYDADDYDKVLKRWTRHTRIIKQLDTPLKVHATFFSPDYRAAYLARYRKMFALPEPQARAMAAKLERQWKESFSIVIVAATHDMSWNDFDRNDSVWRLSLVDDDGRQVEATTIVRTRRITATLKVLYPHIDDFYQIYRVRFPRNTPDGRPLLRGDTRSIALQIAGPLGIAKLVWRLK